MTQSKIEFLYANGCSWAQGVGIEKDPIFYGQEVGHLGDLYRRYSWPGQLAELIGCNHQNDGLGAGSNQRIFRTTCEFIRKYPREKYQNLLVVIGWTSPERDELYLEDEQERNWIIFNPLTPISPQSTNYNRYSDDTIRDLSRYHEIHTRYVQANLFDLKRFYQNVYLMSNLLENLGIRYLFFSSFGGWSMGNNLLQNPFKEFEKERSFISGARFLGMDAGYAMVTFCRQNQLPLSDCLHPMVEGHRRWAENLHGMVEKIF